MRADQLMARYARRRSAGVSEPRRESAEGFPYSERHVQCVWHDGAWGESVLKTADGEVVRVEHPGRWNLEAGPDFLDAQLELGAARRKVRGDIEVHVRPGDWQAHRHGVDPRYRRVVAHVTWFEGGAPSSGDGAMIHIPLRPAVECNPVFSMECIDVTAYPYAALPQRESPCAGRLRSWSVADRRHLLEAAGEMRLALKAERLRRAIRERGAEQVFYEEFLGALGYKHNTVAARRLARALPVNLLREASEGNSLRGYALLLGVAGLIPARVAPAWPEATVQFVRGLWDIWWKVRGAWQERCLPPGAWRLAGIRPVNHPVRRLAVGAGLFAAAGDPVSRLLALPAGNGRVWAEAAEAWLAGVAVPDFWLRRLSWGAEPNDQPIALLGSDRLQQIKVNVLVPLLMAQDLPVAPLLAALPEEAENAVTRRMRHVLLGRDAGRATYRGGLVQQGLLQIFRDFCLNERSGCEDCALLPALDGAVSDPVREAVPR